jgi:hypothetical protein
MKTIHKFVLVITIGLSVLMTMGCHFVQPPGPPGLPGLPAPPPPPPIPVP